MPETQRLERSHPPPRMLLGERARTYRGDVGQAINVARLSDGPRLDVQLAHEIDGSEAWYSLEDLEWLSGPLA